MLWYAMIWHDMIWYDVTWYFNDMAYDMIWYDTIWYDMWSNRKYWSLDETFTSDSTTHQSGERRARRGGKYKNKRHVMELQATYRHRDQAHTKPIALFVWSISTILDGYDMIWYVFHMKCTVCAASFHILCWVLCVCHFHIIYKYMYICFKLSPTMMEELNLVRTWYRYHKHNMCRFHCYGCLVIVISLRCAVSFGSFGVSLDMFIIFVFVFVFVSVFVIVICVCVCDLWFVCD